MKIEIVPFSHLSNFERLKLGMSGLGAAGHGKKAIPYLHFLKGRETGTSTLDILNSGTPVEHPLEHPQVKMSPRMEEVKMFSQMGEQHKQQKVKLKWIGRATTGQDVSIRLVTNEPEPLRVAGAVIKVHSQVLRTYSKYFKACLSETWAPNSTSSDPRFYDFSLELQADVECYFDCFSRMESPLLKNFQIIKDFHDVKSSLELLKVASQIEFHELMDSISRYLSSVVWSTEDEIRVREYTSSPGFSRCHAEDLVERLGLGESEEDRQKQLCDVMQQCIRSALSHDGEVSRWPRAFLTELLQGIGSATPSNFARTVVILVNGEAKNMFHEVEKDCRRKVLPLVPGFEGKLRAMCWVLDALLTTRVAEDLVESFAHLDGVRDSISNSQNPMVTEVANLVLRIYEEAVTGELLLKTPARVALLHMWHPLLWQELSPEVYDKATKQLFLTLPLKNQMELLKLRQSEKFDDYISTSSLISKFSKGCDWQAMTLDLDASYPR